jgi:hypothetical protein
MKKFIMDVGTVLRNFKKCFGASLEQARQTSHLPKSQFNDSLSAEDEDSTYQTLKAGEVIRSFFGCLSNAIEDARRSSELPKSRFQSMANAEEKSSTLQVASDLDDAFLRDTGIGEAKLEGDALPGAGDRGIGVSGVVLDESLPEDMVARAWSGPTRSE